VRKEQPQKHFAPRISTDAGIHSDCSEEHSQNDLRPIILKQDIPANVTSERKSQPRKHSSASDSIDAGTVTDIMGWPENALLWIKVTAGIAEMEEDASIR
jgi:hypothetical protein